MKKLDASEVPLHKLFSSDYEFQIPDYQRPYAWRAEQAEQLLTDLEDVLDRAADEPYFLGSIVLVREPGQPLAEVIDGQQRLTTLTILLAVLRDLTDNEQLREDLSRMLREPGNLVVGLAAKPRLRLRNRDADFFRQHVQEGSLRDLLNLKPDALKTDAQVNLRDNAAALHRTLRQWAEPRRLALVQMVAARTFLVVVSTADRASAHRIFSVMNARGLDLSPSDIFKADVIGELPEAVAEEYADRWEGAEERLGRSEFAELFLHLRVIFAKERAKRELLKEFPEQVLSRYLPDRRKEFVDDVLVPYADSYGVLQNQTYSAVSGAEQVNQWLRRLSQVDNNDWKPPALWALRHHGDDPAWLAEFLRRLERLAAALFIRRTYATPRALRYAELLRQLDRKAGLDAAALQLTPEEKADVRARLDGDLYLSGQTRKYVLLRLDETLADQPGVVYQYKVVTVEHVLPQSPRLDSQWRRDFADEQRRTWTHRLANLVLLNRTKNSQAQNYDFDVKKSKYFTGGQGVAIFALTSQVLQQATWTPEVLEKRQRELLDVLVKEWQLT